MVAWLHISDWHQRLLREDQPRAHLREDILKCLLDDVTHRATIDHALERLDFVIFSGDIAHSGHPDEYKLASELLIHPLLQAAGLGPDRFFVVPGNHDIDRSLIDPSSSGRVAEIWNSSTTGDFLDGIDGLLDKESRSKLLKPLSAYGNFLKFDIQRQFSTKTRDPAYFFVETISVNSKRVSLLCLNSTWLSAQNFDIRKKIYDYGYLAVGETQVRTALREAGAADVVIAVMHHPLSWLSEVERNRIEERLTRECHFILHGHQHVPRAHVINTTAGDVIAIPAGASYQERFPSDTRNISSYNFIQVDTDTNKGNVYFRKWSDLRGGWIEDQEIWDDGKYPVVLPSKSKFRISERRTAFHQMHGAAAPYLRKKIAEKVKITINHKIIVIKNLPIVEQEYVYYANLGAGNERDFRVSIDIDERIIDFMKKHRRHQQACVVDHFTCGGIPIHPQWVTDSTIEFKTPLDDRRTAIGWGYRVMEPIIGRWQTAFERFSKDLEVAINWADGLVYRVEPLGGLEIERDISEGGRILKSRGFVSPHQGFVVSWHPVELPGRVPRSAAKRPTRNPVARRRKPPAE